MTTTELIQWAMRAQSARESSWNDKETRYNLTLSQAIVDTKPSNAVSFEIDIVFALNEHSWNEVQEWDFIINQK